MDKIIIKDLEIFAYHGVFESEKQKGQKFYLLVELNLSLRAAGLTDDLTKSVHYGELCHDITAEFTKCSYDLIEKAAESIANYILNTRDSVNSVKLTLKKPYAPIGLPLDFVAVEIERSWRTVYIALGANMGDCEKTLCDAIDEIKKIGKVTKQSSFYKTKPEGGVAKGDFTNAVIEIKTLLQPDELMSKLLEIETKLGRVRTVRWGDRVIDLDILMIDDIISASECLILPHPRMHTRKFVLQPLAEIAPYAMHPTSCMRIFELLELLQKSETPNIAKFKMI